ncbi:MULTISPECIES: hypothetical protein [Cobetia]|nr:MULTISPECIES: hypothetical protein [Cobetia]MDL2192907.1 hypothetical protein [Cobetia sp. LC6]
MSSPSPVLREGMALYLQHGGVGVATQATRFHSLTRIKRVALAA